MLWPVLVLLVLTTGLPSLGAPAPSVTDHDLRQMGVNDLDNFWPTALSRDGRAVYFWELMGPGRREGGVFATLWEFRFRSDGGLVGSRSFPLAMPKPIQMGLTPNESGVVLMAREGASFWHLDLQSGDLREFIAPGLGKTRFVSDPEVLWTDQGHLWTAGYTLTPDGVRGHHTLARLYPEKPEAEALVPEEVNLDEVLAQFHPWKVQHWVNPGLGFVGGIQDGKLDMAVWKPTEGLRSLGLYQQITSAWARGSNQVFTAESLEGQSVAVVYDATTEQRWDLPPVPQEEPYDYPFISDGGKVITVVRGARDGNRMSVFYARRDDDYKLHPLPGFSDVTKGYVRLAPDGRHAVIRNTLGVYLVEIPH